MHTQSRAATPAVAAARRRREPACPRWVRWTRRAGWTRPTTQPATAPAPRTRPAATTATPRCVRRTPQGGPE
jgi:hypothetical protein